MRVRKTIWVVPLFVALGSLQASDAKEILSCVSPFAEVTETASRLGVEAAPTFDEEESRYQKSKPIAEFSPDADPIEKVLNKQWKKISCIAASEAAQNAVTYLSSDKKLDGKYTFFQGYNPSGLTDPAGNVESLRFLPDRNGQLEAQIFPGNSNKADEIHGVKKATNAGFRGHDYITDSDRVISLPSDTELNFDRTIYFKEDGKVFPDEKNKRMEFRCKLHPGDEKFKTPRLLCQVRYFCWAAEENQPSLALVSSMSARQSAPMPAGCALNRQTIGYCSYVAPEHAPVLVFDNGKVPLSGGSSRVGASQL